MLLLRRFFANLMDNPILGLLPMLAMLALALTVGPLWFCVSYLFGARSTGKQRVIALVCSPLALLPLIVIGEATGLVHTGAPRAPTPVPIFRRIGKEITSYTEADLRSELGAPAQTARTDRTDGRSTQTLTWEHLNARGRVAASFEVTLVPCSAGWCAQRARLTKGEEVTAYSEKANERRAWWKSLTDSIFLGFMGLVGSVLVLVSLWQVGEAFQKARKDAAAEHAKTRAATK